MDDFDGDARENETYSSNVAFDISDKRRESDSNGLNLRIASPEREKISVIFCSRERSITAI